MPDKKPGTNNMPLLTNINRLYLVLVASLIEHTSCVDLPHVILYLLSLMRMLSSPSEQVPEPQMVGLCTHELWPGNETSGSNNHISVY